MHFVPVLDWKFKKKTLDTGMSILGVRSIRVLEKTRIMSPLSVSMSVLL